MEVETHDDDKLSFIHIAAATANVIQYLMRQQNDQPDAQKRGEDHCEKESAGRAERFK